MYKWVVESRYYDTDPWVHCVNPKFKWIAKMYVRQVKRWHGPDSIVQLRIRRKDETR